MWVYGANTLDTRVALRGAAGFWLDYWLFLHADEHPFGVPVRSVLLRCRLLRRKYMATTQHVL